MDCHSGKSDEWTRNHGNRRISGLVVVAKMIKGLVILGKITRLVIMGCSVVSVMVMVINIVQTFESIYLFFSTLCQATDDP